MSYRKITAAILCLAVLSLAAAAATAPGSTPGRNAKNMSQRTLNINAWTILTTNYGPFVNPAAGSGGFWGGEFGYIYGAGVWFAATTPGGARGVACGYDPNSGKSEMGPVDPYTESYDNWLTNNKARVYVSTDPVDVLEWPRIVDGKRLIKSRQDSYCKYSDLNPQYGFSGSAIVGVVVEQITYAWNYADNNDIVFFFFNVKNNNDYTLTNCRIAPCVDADIGNEAGTSANDRTAFDYTRNLAIQFQSTPEPGWPKTGCVGFRFFQGPVNNTGATVNVVDLGTPNFSHSIAPGEPLGMTAFKIFTIDIDPQTDENRYLTLEGFNYQNMIRDDYDEAGAETPGDKRFVQASGPFVLGPDSIVTLCVGTMAALDTAALKLASDVAQEIFDNDFELANPPTAPTITYTAGDKSVRISWNKAAEDSADAYWAKIDTTNGGLGTPKWWNYFRGGWQYCTDKTLVDSFRVLVGTGTQVVYRGQLPAVGTDTLEAFYNQKAMYEPYDFQGYIVVKARTMAELMDPLRRDYLGSYYANPDIGFNSATSSYRGGAGWMYDRKDGVQIVPNFSTREHVLPTGNLSLPVWDTLGSDRGLIYTLADDNVVNGIGYYYGVIAYDFQRNVYFTHKCPVTLATNPTENAVFVVPRKPATDYQAPTYRYTHQGGADSKTGGSADLDYQLEVAMPTIMKNDTFHLRWSHLRAFQGTMRVPNYRPILLNSAGTAIDSMNMAMKFGIYGNDVTGTTFFGTIDDQFLMGGLVYKPWINWSQQAPKVDSIVIIEAAGGNRTYPRDSIKVQIQAAVFGGPSYSTAWQWRGSDFEIRWKDTVNASSQPALTARVADLTNNIEVPLEAGVTKANMVKSSWCFNPLAAGNGSVLVDSSTATYTMGMHIAGATVFFNYAGTVMRRMTTLWDKRPETGDVWRVYCSGPRTLTEGNLTTIYTTPAGQVTGLSASLLDKVKVVPNPYLVRANWDVSKNYPNIHFTNLPAKCKIRIYTLAGDLVRVLDHESSYAENDGTERWDLLTTYNRRVASGIYIYQIDAPEIGTKLGKFAIIK